MIVHDPIIKMGDLYILWYRKTDIQPVLGTLPMVLLHDNSTLLHLECFMCKSILGPLFQTKATFTLPVTLDSTAIKPCSSLSYLAGL
jgi:hypothetical protein